MADNVKINQGTATDIATDDVSGVHYQVVKLDYGGDGASARFTGTLPEVSNLVSGTISKVGGGTLGEVTKGTVDTIGLVHADRFATVVSSGTSTLGTIKAAVSGSSIYITDLIISAGSATNVEIGDGGTSTPLIGTLSLTANGGMVSNFRMPVKTTAGSALVYKQSTNGPLTITALGYVD